MNLSRSETGGSGRHQISDFQRHTRCFDCLFRIEREPLWRPLRSTSLSAGCGRHRAAGKASSGSTGAIRWLRVRSRRSVPRPSIAHGVLGAGVQGLQALAPGTFLWPAVHRHSSPASMPSFVHAFEQFATARNGDKFPHGSGIASK